MSEPKKHNFDKLMAEILELRYSDFEKEAKCCFELLDAALAANDSYATAYAYTYLGDAYISKNDTVKTGFYLEKAKIICTENNYDALLLTIYNLLGMCYESLSDEQTALQNYLKAIRLSDALRLSDMADPLSKPVLLNNIGSEFELYQAFDESKKYYLQACELLEINSSEYSDSLNPDYIKLRIWANFSGLYCALNEFEEAALYLHKCEALDLDFDGPKDLLITRGWCSYYVSKKDAKTAIHWADQFIQLYKKSNYDDQYLLHEILISVCSSMIEIKHQPLAKEALHLLLDLSADNEVDQVQQLQRVKVHYFETFGTDQEKMAIYKEYYQAMTKAEKLVNQIRVNGMKNLIYLDEILEEKKTLNEEAHIDELTRVYNRRYFNKLVSKTTDGRIGFIMIDLDYFKEYNDTYGHLEGDLLLQTFSGILKSTAPETVIPCRYGGDEFVCLCQDMSAHEIEAYVQTFRASLVQEAVEHKSSRCSDYVTASIGLSTNEDAPEKDNATLLDEADQALYTSKTSGRNAYTIWHKEKP